MRRLQIAALAFGLSLLFSGVVFAQESDDGGDKAKGYQKVKNYDFSGDTIDGELVKPDSELVGARTFAVQSSLIRIRQDFLREVLKSAEDL